MGTWPSRRGNVTGSLPPGLTSPKTTSATAGPACTPGNQACRIAGASPTMFSSASGRPLKSTTANGLPVALIAAMSSSCLPGRSSVLRESASPLISRVSPRARMTWSAAEATATASAKPASVPQPSGSTCGASVLESVQPWANVAPGLCSLTPSNTVTTSASRPAPHHGPSMSCWFRASGPITAVFSGGIERQDTALVLEQDHRAARGVPRGGQRVGLEHLRLGLGRAGTASTGSRTARRGT